VAYERRNAVWAVLASVSLVLACDPQPAELPSASDGEGGEGGSVAGPVEAAPPARWLESLSEGLVLTYAIRLEDEGSASVRMRVARVVRRGDGVAVQFLPMGAAPDGVAAEGHWLAADGRSLQQIALRGAVLDPLFVPLDTAGRVVRPDVPAAGGSSWSLPATWTGGEEGGERESLSGGWWIDEFDLRLEGPVRGDRCARIARQDGDEVTRLLVCANLGVVEIERGESEERIREHWRLVEVARPIQPTLL